MNGDTPPLATSPRRDSPALRIDVACDAFEAGWRAGQAPRIEDFLVRSEPADRPPLLRELLALELELRRSNGQSVTRGEYRRRFPEHADVIDAAFAAVDTKPGRSQPRPGGILVDPGRNLLFGLLALQCNFVSREALLGAFAAWVADKSRSLGQILRDQGALDEGRFTLLEALVVEHLKQHGGDAAASLAAASSLGSLREELGQLGDSDLEASLAVAGSRSAADPGVTADYTAPSRRAGERFRILRFHREGGLGRVYVARDEELGRDVALKEVRPDKAAGVELRRRFVLEAEINGGLEHPGIVPVYSLGAYDDGRPFYAMRFVEGDSLKEAIETYHREHPQPDPTAVEFRKLLGRFIDVCDAIAFAHSKGVLHRDLKPHNVMLGRFGETLLIDWGLAKATGRREPSGPEADREATLVPPSGSGHAATLGVLGSPPYMSPEQAEGRTESLGPATDVYGLGAILFALLTGRPPVDGESADEILERVRRGEVRPPRTFNLRIPRPLEAVCLKALAARPQDRYPTAQALAEEVERWLADERVAAWREPLPVRAKRWMRRHPFSLGAAVAASLLAVASLSAIAVLQNRANRNLQIAREQADYQAELAIEAVDDFRKAVEANVDVKNNPEQDRLRKTLLRTPHAFYGRLKDELQKTGWGQPKVRQRLAQSYVQLARLTDDIGTQVDAINAYRQAVEILDRLFHDAPNDRDLRHDLVSSLIRLGSLYSRHGQIQPAMDAYRQGLDLSSRAIESNSANAAPGDYLALADCYMGVARENALHGQPRASFDFYRSALGILDKAAVAAPSDPELQSRLTTCHLEIADWESHYGKRSEAQASLETALGIAERLTREVPDVDQYQALLAAIYSDLGVLHAERGQPAAELNAKRQATEIYERIARAHPTNSSYQEFLGMARGNLGNYLLSHGQVQTNRALTSQVLAEQTKLVKQNPENLTFQLSLARAYVGLAGQQFQEGLAAEALKSCRTAVTILERVTQADQSDLSAWSQLAWAHRNIGNIQRGSGRYDDAVNSFQAFLRIMTKLVERDPASTSYQRYLAVAHNDLGMVQYTLGRYNDAKDSTRKALEIQDRLYRLDPTSAVIRDDLAETHSLRANVCDDNGQPDEALQSYEESTRIREGLVHDDSESVNHRHSLAGIYRDFGLFRSRRKQSEQAMELYGKGLRVISRLADEQKGKLTYREDLARTYNSMGVTLNQTGDRVGAAQAYQRAMEVREALARDAPEDFHNLYGLGALYSNLGSNLAQRGQPEPALKWFERAVSMLHQVREKEPRHDITRTLLMTTYLQRSQCWSALGKYDEAIADIDRARPLVPPAGETDFRLSRALVLARAGRHREAVSEAAGLVARHAGSGLVLYNAACVYARAGVAAENDSKLTETERHVLLEANFVQAVALLEKARRTGFLSGPGMAQSVRADPDLEPLHPRADFVSFLGDLTFPDQVFAP